MRFLYIKRAYAMKARATGAISAPDNLAAKHPLSPGAHREFDEAESPVSVPFE